MAIPGAPGKRDAARALGRCHGAIFLSLFGGAWLLLAAYAFGRLTALAALLIAAGAALFVMTAMRFRRRCGKIAEGAFPDGERRRNDRIFGIVNAVTWISVALVFQLLPRLGYKDLAFPAVALLVGLHFFPMPPLYRHPANLVVGACMVVWAILCPLLFHGDRMIGFVASGAGFVLWVGAASALMTASHLLEESPPPK